MSVSVTLCTATFATLRMPRCPTGTPGRLLDGLVSMGSPTGGVGSSIVTMLRSWRALAVVGAIALVAVGCGTSLDLLRPPGTREWIIPVHNASARPAILVVATDGPGMGAAVGSASPATVPAGATIDVVFTVPPGDGWAIFVNPGPNLGALIGARDVPPDRSGRLPLSISIGANGDPSVSAPAGPGWFGQQ